MVRDKVWGGDRDLVGGEVVIDLESKTFTCENCGKTFPKGRTDEEAMRESKENFGNMPQESLAAICDDCYQKFMKWMKANNQNQ